MSSYPQLDQGLHVTSQVPLSALPKLAEQGYKTLICNRPDGESSDQPSFTELRQEAEALGMTVVHIPVVPGQLGPQQVTAMREAIEQARDTQQTPILAFCRTGTRSSTLWALGQAGLKPANEILASAKAAGYDLSALRPKLGAGPDKQASKSHHQVVIIGGGAAGISTAASLLARDPGLDIAIIDPADTHYYQPGWTLVGRGVFKPEQTKRTMQSVLPRGVRWIRDCVAAFEPDQNRVLLGNGQALGYEALVVCPGLKLDWDAIPGLPETLGHNGVTSNYRYDLAPYTWELVQQTKGGKALFTQPAMPIKCAGAPQKVMYLSADHWLRTGRLPNMDIQFHNTGGVLFGVEAYVPALMEYVQKYGIDLNLGSTLVAVDGASKTATFARKDATGQTSEQQIEFDMLHVCPPQTSHDFIAASPLADAAGWVDVDKHSLRHTSYSNVYGLGDAANTPNAKTAAATRKQAPVVAQNVVNQLRGGKAADVHYDGYGSCPLTVEKGKIVLAEFLYGGTLAPTFPKWIINGTKPSWLAWMLKEAILPPVYWSGMLKGREWMVKPTSMQG